MVIITDVLERVAMVTLLGDTHFWTLRDDVIIKDADMGAFRYVEGECYSNRG